MGIIPERKWFVVGCLLFLGSQVCLGRSLTEADCLPARSKQRLQEHLEIRDVAKIVLTVKCAASWVSETSWDVELSVHVFS